MSSARRNNDDVDNIETEAEFDQGPEEQFADNTDYYSEDGYNSDQYAPDNAFEMADLEAALVDTTQIWHDAKPITDFMKIARDGWLELRQRLGMTSISTDTFNRYHVKGYLDEWSAREPCLIYPRYRDTMQQERGVEPTGLKLIRLKNGKLEKETLPNAEEDGFKYYPGMFGWHLVTNTDRHIVLTTNEKDAMAIYEATKELAIALPLADKLDYAVLPYLEEFAIIYLWFPYQSLDAAKELAHIITASRHTERPLELLQMGRKTRIRDVLRLDIFHRRAVPVNGVGPSRGFPPPPRDRDFSGPSSYQPSPFDNKRGAVKERLINSRRYTRGMAQPSRGIGKRGGKRRGRSRDDVGRMEWPDQDSSVQDLLEWVPSQLRPLAHYNYYDIHDYGSRVNQSRSWSPTNAARHSSRAQQYSSEDAELPWSRQRQTIVVDQEDANEVQPRSTKSQRLRLKATNEKLGRTASPARKGSSLKIQNSPRPESPQQKFADNNLAKFKRFPVLNDVLGGFRSAELTVFSGATGVGKTTFLCEYTIDLAKQGVRTLFCSFEMEDVQVMKWMACQFAEKALWRPEYHSQLDRILDRFERMEGGPIMINAQAFQGKTPLEVADTIREQVIMSRINHVIIDNLQFLCGTLAPNSHADRFNMQDTFVALLRRLATECNVHVSVVVHPRKEDPTLDYRLGHHHQYYGQSRAMQEADNVLVIVRKRDPDGTVRKYLHITKNRYLGNRIDGDVLEMRFDRNTLCHSLRDLRHLRHPRSLYAD